MAKSTQNLCSRHAQEWKMLYLQDPKESGELYFFEQQTDNGHKRMRSGRAHERGGRERERERERESTSAPMNGQKLVNFICPNRWRN
jgi:hypothetical protein